MVLPCPRREPLDSDINTTESDDTDVDTTQLALGLGAEWAWTPRGWAACRFTAGAVAILLVVVAAAAGTFRSEGDSSVARSDHLDQVFKLRQSAMALDNCTLGYYGTALDIHGTGMQWSFDSMTACAKVCDAREGCRAFEFHDKSGTCSTYADGYTLGGLQQHRWLTCLKEGLSAGTGQVSVAIAGGGIDQNAAQLIETLGKEEVKEKFRRDVKEKLDKTASIRALKDGDLAVDLVSVDLSVDRERVLVDLMPELSLPPMFSSHMVLPADVPTTLWGLAKHGAADVRVQIGGQKFADHPNESGFWHVELPAMAGSDVPTDIVVSYSSVNLTLSDVVFGELYLCSGASNVEMSLDWSNDSQRVVEESAAYSQRMRFLTVERQQMYKPALSFRTRHEWQQVQNTDSTKEFSALCYFFGVEQLKRRPRVPVGLISAAFGATKAAQWAPRQALIDCHEPVDERAGYGPWWEPTATSVLWYAMVHPWTFIAIKGVVLHLKPSGCLLPAMARRWQETWADHGLPKPFVVAAQFGCDTRERGSAYEVTNERLQQMHLLDVEQTALAVTADLCDMASKFDYIHSEFKREEAARLAQVAEAMLDNEGERKTSQRFFPAPTGVRIHEWDGSKGCGQCDSSACKSLSFSIQLEFDQDVVVKPKFQALLGKSAHINGFTLYPGGRFSAPKRLSLTDVHGTTVQLNASIFASDLAWRDVWPAMLVYGDGAFPIMPLTNLAGHPVGPFNVTVTKDGIASV